MKVEEPIGEEIYFQYTSDPPPHQTSTILYNVMQCPPGFVYHHCQYRIAGRGMNWAA